MFRRWIIYGLTGECGCVYYVGITVNASRRMSEHKKNYGRRVKYKVLEEGIGDDAGYAAELKWIRHFLDAGIWLANRAIWSSVSGRFTICDSTRERLSRINKGRAKTAEHRARISAANKGKSHNWSDEGERRLAATQFQPGQNTWAAFSDELKASRTAKVKSLWAAIPPEERSRRATERNEKAWSKYSPEQRAARGAAISAAKLANGDRAAESVSASWSRLSPEARAARGAAISAGRLAAKARRAGLSP